MENTNANLNFRLSDDSLKSLVASWRRAWALNEHFQASDFILYSIFRGKAPNSGFTPFTNSSKLENNHPYSGYIDGISAIHWGEFSSIFDDYLPCPTHELSAVLRQWSQDNVY